MKNILSQLSCVIAAQNGSHALAGQNPGFYLLSTVALLVGHLRLAAAV